MGSNGQGMGKLGLGVALAFAALPASCSLTGSRHAFRAAPPGAKGQLHALQGPWTGLENLDGLIHRSGAAGDGEGKPTRDPLRRDTVAIFFDNAFFKYLPDMGLSNEVVVVFTIYEGAEGVDANTVVKIVGPMQGLPDASYPNQVNHPVYGPKYVEHDTLTLRAQIVEFDEDENLNTAAMLDFIGEIGQSMSLSNPVTAGEITLAKEVGKTLVDLNHNDIILDFTFTLLPYDERGWKPAGPSLPSGTTIPLVEGAFGVIQEETQTPTNKFFFFVSRTWRNSDPWTGNPRTWLPAVVTIPFSLLWDLVIFPVTVVNRTFFDTPDRGALRPLEYVPYGFAPDLSVQLADAGESVWMEATGKRLVTASRPDTPGKPYEVKTWMLFHAMRGLDPSQWDQRQKLSEAEKEIQRMLKDPPVRDVLKTAGPRIAKLMSIVEELKEAAGLAEEAAQHAQLLEPSSGYAFLRSDASLAISIRTKSESPPEARLRTANGGEHGVTIAPNGTQPDRWTVHVPPLNDPDAGPARLELTTTPEKGRHVEFTQPFNLVAPVDGALVKVRRAEIPQDPPTEASYTVEGLGPIIELISELKLEMGPGLGASTAVLDWTREQAGLRFSLKPGLPAPTMIQIGLRHGLGRYDIQATWEPTSLISTTSVTGPPHGLKPSSPPAAGAEAAHSGSASPPQQ